MNSNQLNNEENWSEIYKSIYLFIYYLFILVLVIPLFIARYHGSLVGGRESQVTYLVKGRESQWYSHDSRTENVESEWMKTQNGNHFGSYVKFGNHRGCLKGTQEWEFFWLRFWILYYFIVSYVKLLRFSKKNFLTGPVLEEVRFFRVVLGLAEWKNFLS